MNAAQRWLLRFPLRIVLSQRANAVARRVRQWRRQLYRMSATVELFYRVDDPAAHLLLLMLSPLAESYEIDVRVRLLAHDKTTADALKRQQVQWQLDDARCFGTALGLAPLTAPLLRVRDGVESAIARMLRLDKPLADIQRLSTAYWQGDEQTLMPVLERLTPRDRAHADVLMRHGAARLETLGHYDSAALHYDGEFYRGVERLRHLTQRLRAEGLAGTSGAQQRGELATRLDAIESTHQQLPAIAADSDAPITFYFSFRSPYSWLAFDRVCALAKRAGRSLTLCPVLPMVMRGVPLPNAKRRYLLLDAAREARRHNVPFGDIVDPLGVGITHCMAGFFYASEYGVAERYVRAAMSAILSGGVDVSTPRGMGRVLERVGLSWRGLRPWLAVDRWEPSVESNREALERLGLWGVPTLVVDGQAVWGQDRLWQFKQSGEQTPP